MHAVQHTITDDSFRHGWDALFATATEGVMHVPEQYDKIFPRALAISVICLTKALEIGMVSSMVIARIRLFTLEGTENGNDRSRSYAKPARKISTYSKTSI